VPDSVGGITWFLSHLNLTLLVHDVDLRPKSHLVGSLFVVAQSIIVPSLST